VSLPPPVMLPPPPVTGPPDGTAVTVTPGVADTVTGGAVTVAVTVTAGEPDAVPADGVTPGVPVGDVVGVNVAGEVADDDEGGADDDTAGAGLSAPDSVAACAAVPVSAIAAAPMARQPDARLMRIAIPAPVRRTALSRSSRVTDQIEDRNVAMNNRQAPAKPRSTA
jgi:hypothetical protein